jgi:hypothetical protein
MRRFVFAVIFLVGFFMFLVGCRSGKTATNSITISDISKNDSTIKKSSSLYSIDTSKTIGYEISYTKVEYYRPSKDTVYKGKEGYYVPAVKSKTTIIFKANSQKNGISKTATTSDSATVTKLKQNINVHESKSVKTDPIIKPIYVITTIFIIVFAIIFIFRKVPVVKWLLSLIKTS